MGIPTSADIEDAGEVCWNLHLLREDVQLAARHADPRTTTVYDRRRQELDRHAAYVVIAFVAGG